jgi:hypothetical protein
MLLREFFYKSNPIIVEGGNVQIGPHSAERINLKKIPRNQIVPVIDNLLHSVNSAFQSKFKSPLWAPQLLQKKEFLSGSAFHFLNPGIPDEKFVKHKPSVGDIDTMVDEKKREQVELFLNTITNKKVGPATLLGFKPNPGGDQFITLWEFSEPPIKIQIDLELVPYDELGPTTWSKFSHSSDWADLEAGVKGVFHKYLLRAFTTNTLKDRLVQMKTKLKPVKSTDIAFAVTGGMRQKYKPVLDGGKQKVVDGLPVYTEVPAKDSTYINSAEGMFELIFGKPPVGGEEKLLGSFMGGLQLANKYLDAAHKKLLLDGFVNTLYGQTAQELYKGDPESDKAEKEVALNTMLKALGMKADASINQMKNAFYGSYKMDEELDEDDVVSSRRSGISHLQGMKDLEFIELIKKIKNDYKGKLSNVKMTLKVDGLGARFGKDANGRPFFESSRSGPIFTAGSFTSHAKSRGFEGEKLERAEKYDEIYNLIINSEFMKKLPNDIKVHCEVMYNPMAEETENGLKFVTVSYDRNQLGKVMTIVPFYAEVASTGEKYSKSEQVKDMLINIKEENGIKFVDDRLAAGEIDITGEIDPLLTMVNDQFIAKLTSRTRADAEEKSQLKALVQSVKDNLADYIFRHPSIAGKEKLGKDIEGIILHRDKEVPLKITTPDFKQAIAAKRNPNATK